MTQQENPQPETLHEELSAYLDGELDDQEVRRVEERLARDAEYRKELQRLERAWDLLDRLPRATVDEEFSKSTIEMVAVAAAEEADAVHAQTPRRVRRRRWLGLVTGLAAVMGGFFLGRALWTDPNQRLIDDLPVLQHFELFYQVESIEFLRLLDQAKLFDDAEGEHAD